MYDRLAANRNSMLVTDQFLTKCSENAGAYYNHTEMNPELTLLQRARQFEEQALVEIYDRYSPAIYRYAYRLLGDASLAEDCVSETFSRFLSSLRRGKGPHQHLQAYLYQIAHNFVTDYYRRQPAQELRLEPNDVNTEQDGESLTIWTETTPQGLRSALSRLTPDQRQVIALKYLEGMDNASIAQVVQKPVGAIKSLQHRAINSLRRQLVQDQET